MQQLNRYTGQFIDALRFLAKLNKAYRKTLPDFAEIERFVQSNKTGELKPIYEKLRRELLKPLAESYLARLGSPVNIANRCHSMSQGFLETWKNIEIGNEYPLSVTIGNVYFKNENIYNLSKSALKRILNEGRRLDKSLDVHVWLTWDDMTVVDLSIIPTLIHRKVLAEPEDNSLALVWTEDAPGDFLFEPLLVDNDFFHKVDDGRTVYQNF